MEKKLKSNQCVRSTTAYYFLFQLSIIVLLSLVWGEIRMSRHSRVGDLCQCQLMTHGGEEGLKWAKQVSRIILIAPNHKGSKKV